MTDNQCGCNHDHDHDHDAEELVVTVTDENGEEVEMIMIETFNCNEKLYALLLERHNLEGDGIILRIEQDGEDMILCNIEDEDEWAEVQKTYEDVLLNQDQT